MKSVTEIIGLQYGDEGKGKVSCYETSNAAMVIRSTGGSNAGHTVVYKGKKYALHLIPSGIVREGAISVLAPGMVIDPSELIEEIKMLRSAGIKVTPKTLMVSDRARIVMPYHRKLDLFLEKKKKKPVGTTGRGIGPAYASQAYRIGLRMFDLLKDDVVEWCKNIISQELATLPEELSRGDAYVREMAEKCKEYAEFLKPFICNTQKIVNDYIREGKKIVIEGAQAYSLDIDHGDYPFVTSSHPNASGTAAAVCIGPTNVSEVIGVIKAYTSRVGEGPFVTELKDSIGDKIRELGHEYGTTTGRPRRCGWLDLVQVKESVESNGVTALAVNHVDTIGKLAILCTCVKYVYGEEIIDYSPIDKENVYPLYYHFLGKWQISEDCHSYEDLPKEAKRYIEFIENFTGVPVRYIGIGPRDEDVIIKPLTDE